MEFKSVEINSDWNSGPKALVGWSMCEVGQSVPKGIRIRESID